MNRLKALLADVFTSKKALAALGTILMIVLQSLGLPIDEAMMDKILVIVGIYIGGQSIADIGKPSAMISAEGDKERQAYRLNRMT